MANRIHSIAQGNFDTAVDQQDAYRSLAAAFEAYYENVFQMAVEEDADVDSVTEDFLTLVKQHDIDVYQAMWTF